MRIELSPTISHDRQSLVFPGVAQFSPEQPRHRFLEDIHKFVGQIFAGSSARSRARSSRLKPKGSLFRNGERSAL
jgi:hypothetical protein